MFLDFYFLRFYFLRILFPNLRKRWSQALFIMMMIHFFSFLFEIFFKIGFSLTQWKKCYPFLLWFWFIQFYKFKEKLAIILILWSWWWRWSSLWCYFWFGFSSTSFKLWILLHLFVFLFFTRFFHWKFHLILSFLSFHWNVSVFNEIVDHLHHQLVHSVDPSIHPSFVIIKNISFDPGSLNHITPSWKCKTQHQTHDNINIKSHLLTEL